MKHNIDINKYECISFDIFDTLIKRVVPDPHDVFSLMQQYCNKRKIPLPDDFKNKRLMAERTVNTQSRRPSTIQEIYDYFCANYGGDARKLEAIEKWIELNVCKPNPDIVAIFYECIQKDKKVYIISDMYLDAVFLEKMLENCGISGYDKLFVSCEYRVTKTTVKLFEVVLDDVKGTPSKWLHIGDNPKGDISSPKKLGINTYQIEQKKSCKYLVKAEVNDWLDFVMMNRCADIVGESMRENESMGAKVLGPLLTGFSKWMATQLKSLGIHKVFFLSRDGFTMKRAFEAIYSGEFETAYIYASRRSWTVPAIWMEPEYEDILKNVSMFPQTSVYSFLMRIGILPEKCKKEIRLSGLDVNTVIDKTLLPKSKEFKALYSFVKDKVIINSKEEYKALTEYLKSEGVEGKVAIVDIGYNGTMQKALQIILSSMGIRNEIHGFYMGLNPKSKLIMNHEINAYSFLYGPNHKNKYQDNINAFISVFESIFLAQHGSTYRFKMGDGIVEAEFYEYEYVAQKERYVDEIQIITSFQHGALKYVEYVSEMVRNELLVINNHLAINNLLCMGLRPEKVGVGLFSDFRMFDTRVSHIAHPDPLIRYLLNPKKFKKDFSASTWKIAFLYRLLRIPLPYEQIYYTLKRIAKT